MGKKTNLKDLYIRVGLNCFLILLAGFFTYFGIETLIFAFSLKDPFSFVMTFFSSNLIILISLALLIGFVFKIIHLLKDDPADNNKSTN